MNDAAVRKKSPRAPSLPLGDAIEAAIKVYEKEHRHAAPIEAVAQHLGYKSANNGAALRQIASIRYYGLFERPADGQIAVSKDVESYQYAPSADIRDGIARQWLRAPPVFAELLDKYPDALPSDKTLRYDLIQRGFLPDTVDSVLNAFRASVEFVRYYAPRFSGASEQEKPDSISSPPAAPPESISLGQPEANDTDRIPIRLPGGRRAYVEIPSPFYAADKERIKKQIDLLLTAEDEVLLS